MTTEYKVSSPMSLRSALSGPPAILLCFAAIAEAVFWYCGMQNQFSEVWLVLVAVPLVLHFSVPKKASQPSKVAKRVDDDESPRKRDAQDVQSGAARAPRKLPSERTAPNAASPTGPLSGERAAMRA